MDLRLMFDVGLALASLISALGLALLICSRHTRMATLIQAMGADIRAAVSDEIAQLQLEMGVDPGAMRPQASNAYEPARDLRIETPPVNHPQPNRSEMRQADAAFLAKVAGGARPSKTANGFSVNGR